MLSLVLALACGPQPVEDLAEQTLEVETLSVETLSGVLPLADQGWLVASEEGLSLQHPLSVQGTWVWDRPTVLSAAIQHPELGLMVVTDGGLLGGQGLLGRSALEAETGAVQSIYGAGDALVLEAEAGLFAWRAGQLFALSGYEGPVAMGADQSITVQEGRHRVHLVRSGAGWAELERAPMRAQAAGVDGEGTLWTLSGKDLLRGDSAAWALPTEPVSLHTCAQAPGVWVVDEQGMGWFFDSEARHRAAVPEGAVLDGQCRWLLADYSGLTRHSVDRPVALWGLQPGEGVLGDTPLVVLPTFPEQVTEIQLRVNGEDQILDAGAWTLEPGQWPEGGTLEVVVTYEDTVTSRMERSFEVADAGEPTWTEDVEPIYNAHCALCHSNGTETVLRDAQDWEDNIELILTSVSSGAMPLGKTPLTGAEIATIRAWQAGGFE